METDGLTLGETVAACRRAVAELIERMDEAPWPYRLVLRRRALRLWRGLDELEDTIGYQRDRTLRELGIIP